MAGMEMEIDKLKDELAECRAMLSENIWVSYEDHLICFSCRSKHHEGHKPDCKLNALLIDPENQDLLKGSNDDK